MRVLWHRLPAGWRSARNVSTHLVNEEVLAAVCRGDEAEPAEPLPPQSAPKDRSNSGIRAGGADVQRRRGRDAYPLVASNHFTEPVDFAMLPYCLVPNGTRSRNC